MLRLACPNCQLFSFFMIFASRSSKLDPTLIGFLKLLYYTFKAITPVLYRYSVDTVLRLKMKGFLRIFL
jgi:hypothetical protein